MTDDLEKLKAALQSAPPAPDPDAKSAAMRLAMGNFDRAQESRDPARHMSDRPEGTGFLTGVRDMLIKLTSKQALAATASIAALAVGVIIALPQSQRPGTPVLSDDTSKTVATPSAQAEGPAKPVVAPEAAPEIRTEAAEVPGSRSPNAFGNPAGPPNVTPAVRPDNTQPLTIPEATPAPAPQEQSAMVDEESEALPEPEVRFESDFADTPAPRRLAPGAMASTGMFGGGGGAPAQSSPQAPAASTGSLPRDRGVPAAEMALSDQLPVTRPDPNTEAFPEVEDGAVKSVSTDPVSTFSIDVDTASYSVLRSSLTNGYLMPPDAVRVEEMVNYFPYDYPAPAADEAPFRPTVNVVQTPWNEDTRLVHIGIQGRTPSIDGRPPLNLVFLIDTSGSMQDRNKLPLLKQSFRLMLGQLRPEDQVAIVTYAGSAGQVLAPTEASDGATILAALDRLEAGGSTAGQAGLQQAYQVAEGMADDGEVTRIVLATDGDFNVGISDPDQLKTYIEDKRKSGTYLSVLGFGRGNLDDATMQALAQNGNGTAAYIDTLSEAQKVLVDQLTGALFPIANDVKIQMEFNPAVIAEYRLIGYETRALKREDFNNDRIDAGDIGAGHTVTAVYEVTPVGSPAVRNDQLRYSAAEPEAPVVANTNELGFLKLRYKEPGQSRSDLIEMPIAAKTVSGDEETSAGLSRLGIDAVGSTGSDVYFAIAIAGFGQLLTGADYLGDWGWDDAIALANAAKGDDPYGYRTEAVQLMRLAQSLSR